VVDTPGSVDADAVTDAPARPKRSRGAKADPEVAADASPEAETATVVEADASAAVEAPAAEEAEAPAAAPTEVEDEGPSARAPRGARAKKAPAATRAKTKAERGTYVRTPAAPAEQGPRKERRGVVTSDKGEKSITVRVDEMKRHRKYKKIMRRSIKLNAHDERNEAKIGDVVRIIETRPLSKTKRWRLVEIVEVAQ
jgi:small subunit ribosomal protein S17